jgi:hypothetical protein
MNLYQNAFKKILFLGILFISFFSNPISSFAQDYCSEDSIFPPLVVCGRSEATGCGKFTEACKLEHVPVVLGNLIQWVILMLLMTVPLYVMYLGILMVAKRGIPEEMVKLKSRLIWTIFFLIIIFASWIIIKEIVNIFKISSEVPSFLLNSDGSVIQNPGSSIR